MTTKSISLKRSFSVSHFSLNTWLGFFCTLFNLGVFLLPVSWAADTYGGSYSLFVMSGYIRKSSQALSIALDMLEVLGGGSSSAVLQIRFACILCALLLPLVIIAILLQGGSMILMLADAKFAEKVLLASGVSTVLCSVFFCTAVFRLYEYADVIASIFGFSFSVSTVPFLVISFGIISTISAVLKMVDGSAS